MEYAWLVRAGYAYEDGAWYGDVHQFRILWTLPGKALTFWSLYGQDAPAAHLTNVGIHLFNGALVACLAWALIGDPLATIAAATVFLLAPIQSEAVAYLAARGDLLVTTCALVGANAAAQWPRWGWHVLIVLAAVAALFCDELGPVVVGLIGVTIATKWRHERFVDLECLLFLAPVALAVTIMATPRAAVWMHLEGAQMPWSTFWLGQTVTFWRLAALLIDPRWLSIDHNVAHLASAWTVGAVVMTIAVAGIFGLGVWLGRTPVLVWTLTWVAISIAPHFVFRTGEWLNEHQLYLGMVGASVGIGALLAWLRDDPRASLSTDAFRSA